jgi:hypothetical protein
MTTPPRPLIAVTAGPPPAEWLRLARLARTLSWLTLAWMGIEGGVAIGAAIAAGSVALLGFGLDSGIEALASIIVIWRFTGTRLASPTAERRAQKLVAASFLLLAPYIAAEAIRALAAGDHAETSIAGLVLTAGTAIFEPALGVTTPRRPERGCLSPTSVQATWHAPPHLLFRPNGAGISPSGRPTRSAGWVQKLLGELRPCVLDVADGGQS